MIGEEILMEIDSTLDQLIQNAEAMQRVQAEVLSELEIEAFQKTQESLMHHLLNMDRCLAEKRKGISSSKIQEKLTKFETLEKGCKARLSSVKGKRPFFSKRRSKRFLKT